MPSVSPAVEEHVDNWRLLVLKGDVTQGKVYATVQNKTSLHVVTLEFLKREGWEDKHYENVVINYFEQVDHYERSGRSFGPQTALRKSLEDGVQNAFGSDPRWKIPEESVFHIVKQHPEEPLNVAFGWEAEAVNYVKEYMTFISSLQPVERLLGSTQAALSSHTIDGGVVPVADIIFLDSFSSFRGGAMRVATKADHTMLVYKGVHFSDILAFNQNAFRCHINGIFREIEMLCKILSPHPNIMPPPLAFATIKGRLDDNDGNPTSGGAVPSLVCGALYPLYKKGSLADAIKVAVSKNVPIPLATRAKWCYQLASALHHVHFVDNAWHQDLKTANILIDDNDNLVLIDWEQCGANTFALAPEANGSFDLDLAGMSNYAAADDRPVLYIPYDGPERRNNFIGAPAWVVFPDWKQQCPRAVELAEVWSLGTMMWQILEQVALEHSADIEREYEGILNGVCWAEKSAGVPPAWKDVVGRCRTVDPNSRLRMRDLVEFWKSEAEKLAVQRDG